MHLKVHIDQNEGGMPGSQASVEFAQAAQPASVMTLYVDGSRLEGKLGYAAVWKDPAARVPEHWVHDEGSTTLDGAGLQRRDQSLIVEAELRGLKMGLNNAVLWRPAGVDTVFVLTDSISALNRVRFWKEDASTAGPYEPILVQMKYLAGRLHEQGVAVTLRWLKSRSHVDGHDVADIWARMASGAGPDITTGYFERHHEVRLLVAQQASWEKKNREQSLEDEFAAFEREMEEME